MAACRMQLFADSHVVEGFLKSWGMILASEIGDKTFFIAAIMAMKHSRAVVSFHSASVLNHDAEALINPNCSTGMYLLTE